MVAAGQAMELDLHHAILPPVGRIRPDTARLFADAVPVAGSPFHVLCPQDQVLHAVVHLVHDSDFVGRLRDLLDIDALFRRVPLADRVARAALVERARLHGMEKPLHLAAHLCRLLVRHAGLRCTDCRERRDAVRRCTAHRSSRSPTGSSAPRTARTARLGRGGPPRCCWKRARTGCACRRGCWRITPRPRGMRNLTQLATKRRAASRRLTAARRRACSLTGRAQSAHCPARKIPRHVAGSPGLTPRCASPSTAKRPFAAPEPRSPICSPRWTPSASAWPSSATARSSRVRRHATTVLEPGDRA